MIGRLPARFPRPLAAMCGVLLALGLTACGKTNDPTSAENNGVYIQAGPITYQLEISRQLNQYSTEDSQYLKGLPPGEASITANQLWYGVFLWAKNQTNSPQRTGRPDQFDILDTVGNRYHPIQLDSSANPFAWTTQVLSTGGIQPGPGPIAADGPTQGSLLLFKVPQSVYSNRPLVLEIRSPTGKVEATIMLDL